MRFLNITIGALILAFSIQSCGSGTNGDNMKTDATGLNISPDQLTTMVDPVCGMDLTNFKITDTAHYHSHVIPFCAPGCKHAFEEEPEKYVQN